MADKADRTERPGIVSQPQQKAVAGFDLANTLDLFNKQRDLTQQRQELQKKQLTEVQKQNVELGALQVESVKSKSAFAEAMSEEVGGLIKLNEKGKRQRELQGGGFIDQLQAMQDAMLDPMNATSEGRARQRAEISANVNALTTIESVNQDLIAGKMELVQTKTKLKGQKLEQISMLEAQNQELISAEVERQKTILQGLGANATARELILNEMTYEQIVQAKENVDAAGNVVIQGFSFPKAVLDTKLASLEEITFSAQVKRLGITKEHAALEAANNKKILRNLPLLQIQKLQAGQPIKIKIGNEEVQYAPSDFDIGDIKAEHEAKTQARDNMLADEQASLNFGDLQTTVAQEHEKYRRLYERSPLGSPLRNTASERLTKLNTLYNTVNELESQYKANPTPENRATLLRYKAMLGEAYTKESAKDDVLIENEAKRLGRGNAQLTAANRSFLLGQTVSQEDVLKYSVESLIKQIPPAEMLGPETAKLAKKFYDEEISKKRDEVSLADTLKGDELKRFVANGAVERAVTESVKGQTDRFISDQADGALVADPILRDNPIMQARNYKGERIFDRASLLTMVKDADQRGLSEFSQDPRYSWLKPEDYAAFDAGKPVSRDGVTMTPLDFMRAVQPYQNVQFLLSLDAKQPGLAAQYVDWWNRNGNTFAREFSLKQANPAATSTMQESAIKTMGSAQIENGMREYGLGLMDAAAAYKDTQRNQRMKWVSYDTQPSNRQAALLQFDSDLSNGEKTLIYKGVIDPLLEQASKQKLDYDETNIYVDEAMTNLEQLIPGYKENKPLKNAVQKMLGKRAHVTTQLEALMDSPWLYSNDKTVADDVWGRISPENRTESFNQMGAIGGVLSNPTGGDMSTGDPLIDSNPFARLAGQAVLGGRSNRRQIKRPFWSADGNDGWLTNETGTRPYDWYRNIMNAKPAK